MARIRSVHPGLWTDEDFVSCSSMARLLLIGLLNEADDQGVFKWKPVALKMRLFPADNVDVPTLLEELSEFGWVRRYQVGERNYGSIKNFCNHQKPKSPTYTHPVTTFVLKHTAFKQTEKGPAPNLIDPDYGSDDSSSQQISEITEAEQDQLPEKREEPPDQHGSVPGKGEIASQMERRGEKRRGEKGKDKLSSFDNDAPDPNPPDPGSDCREAVEIYNQIASELDWPECQKLIKTRASQLRRRLSDCGGIEGWRQAMARARASPFLRGETQRGPGHENWTVNIDFFLQESKFTKLMEGVYDPGRRSNGNQNQRGGTILDAGRAAVAQILAEDENGDGGNRQGDLGSVLDAEEFR